MKTQNDKGNVSLPRIAVTAATKAIDTRYRGYRMRSRLEARWAVYFDALGIYWHYEVEAFDLSSVAPDLGAYLPDFWLSQVKMWAEVKPCEFSQIEIRKCDALAKITGFPCLMLDGMPEDRAYWAREPHASTYWPDEEDYLIDAQYLAENRFYGSTGLDRGAKASESFRRDDSVFEAIDAARAARFEYGQAPTFQRRHD